VTSLGQKALKGMVALGVRQLGVVLLNVGGGIVLARLLTQEQFGVYGVALLVLMLLAALSDAGIGAGLIQSAKEPLREDYDAVFSIQQCITLCLCVLLLLLAPLLAGLYHLDVDGVLMFRLIALGVLGAATQAIIQVWLERKLDFGRLALIEILQALGFNVTVILLAGQGFGIVAFGWAILARAIVGALIALLCSSYRPRFHWNIPRARPFLKFGLEYQGSNLLAVLNTAVTPVLVFAFFGLAGSGIVGWSTSIINYLQQPLLVLNRLFFPIFSRLQGKNELIDFANAAYLATSFVFYGMAVLLWSNTPLLVELVYTSKWTAALPVLYGLSLAALLVPMSIPNGALANSRGQARLILKINFFRTVSFWLLMYFAFSLNHNLIVYVIVQAIVELSHLILYGLLKKELPLKAFHSVAPPLISAMIAVMAARIFSSFVEESWRGLILTLGVGGACYIVLFASIVLFLARLKPNSIYLMVVSVFERKVRYLMRRT